MGIQASKMISLQNFGNCSSVQDSRPQIYLPAIEGWVASTRSNFSKCFRAFLIFIRVAAEAKTEKKKKIKAMEITTILRRQTMIMMRKKRKHDDEQDY